MEGCIIIDELQPLSVDPPRIDIVGKDELNPRFLRIEPFYVVSILVLYSSMFSFLFYTVFPVSHCFWGFCLTLYYKYNPCCTCKIN